MSESSALSKAILALSQPGAVVLYPTETVYGLGGRACDAASALRIAELKGRGLQPLIVLLDGATARALLPQLPEAGRALAARHWPGPLTLVVPRALCAAIPGGVADEVLAGAEGVGVRWSGHPVAEALVAAVGPITSTSANPHGAPTPLRAQDCLLQVDAVVDGGELAPSAPSTLVDARDGRVLRQGAIRVDLG